MQRLIIRVVQVEEGRNCLCQEVDILLVFAMFHASLHDRAQTVLHETASTVK